MNRGGLLLSTLMLLMAQMPCVMCPCPTDGGVAPAATARHCCGHDQHVDVSKAQRAQAATRPAIAPDSHTHGVILTDLLVDGTRATFEAPGAHANLSFVPGEPAHPLPRPHASDRGLVPPPPRPPSAACLADEVRQLS